MTDFIQLHMLIAYPPSNLNRDDLGRPKTAVVGGRQRLRISSQSLKRAWRTSEVFEQYVNGAIGVRTRELGKFIKRSLAEGTPLMDLVYETGKNDGTRKALSPEEAGEWAVKFVQVINKGKVEASSDKKEKKDKSSETSDSEIFNEKGLEIGQLTHFSPEEVSKIDTLLEVIASGEKVNEKDLFVYTTDQSAVDIGMFGRMLASFPMYSVEAAVQVAHAFTVNQVAIEDDYFTAVDDLNRGLEDMGAGHLGEIEFGSGVFYLYICINRTLLLENVHGNVSLMSAALKGLVEAAAKVGPSGKQSTFASRAYASYILAERGRQQPRSLSVSFLKPVRGEDMLGEAIKQLEETRKNFDENYGTCADAFKVLNVLSSDEKTCALDELCTFVADENV